VVDCDRLAAGLRPAVLAGVVVALGDVSPAERHRRAGKPVVVRQADDLRGPEAPVGRPHARPVSRRCERRPVGPVVEPVLVRLDSLRRLVPEHDERSQHGCDMDWLPVPVQDQRGKLEHVAGHHCLHRQGNTEGVRRELNPSLRAPQARVLPLHHGHHRKGWSNPPARAGAEGAGVEPARLIAHPRSRRVPSPIGWPFLV
jgi:hypothetical protein